MSNNINDYRIKQESKDIFVVQKRRITTEIVPYYWIFDELVDKEEWVNVDEKGNYCGFISLYKPPFKTKRYKTLKEAEEAAIEFTKYPIYHNINTY